MKLSYSILLLLPIFASEEFSLAERPNVLIIYADDQGSLDLGCFADNELQTPNLDHLADQGLKLTQMYAPAPVCSASRTGLMTGRYPARAGQPGNGPLDAGEVTIAETFSESGYRTGQVGKWHLGSTETQNPSGQGFGDWFGHLGGCIDNYSHFFFWAGPNRHDLFDNGHEVHRPGEYFPDLMEARCKQFIDGGGEQPWLLYWAFNSPHYPYQGTPKWLKHYRDLPTPRREYCAFVSSMDETIGRVIDHLDATGQRDNTIVIFQPDHGHSTEERAFGGGGNAGPYRGAKFSLFEGGIRVPTVVRYPNGFPSNQTRDQFFAGCDWLPTLSDICGVPLPRDSSGNPVKLDGISITDYLAENKALNRDPYYWQFGSGKSSQWAVRAGSWKLIANPKDTSIKDPKLQRLSTNYFLSNLESDPGEQTNLAKENPQKLHELQAIGRAIQSEWK